MTGGPLPDGRQQWRQDAISQLLDTEDAAVLFAAGCQEKQARFHPRFDPIVLLSAPAEGLTGRPAPRADDPSGKSPTRLERMLKDLRMAGPLPRKVADHEIQTTKPLSDAVAEVLRITGV